MNWVLMPFQNCWDLTEAAARDVLAQTLPDTALLLINNGSDQATTQAVHQFLALHPEQQVMLWDWIPGLPSLAATWNRALQFVWASDGQQALVVNNDVRLWKGTYEGLTAVQETTGGWFVTATGVTAPQLAAATDDDIRQGLRSRGGPDFSCFLITRDCHRWFQFDEAFQPAYHEDNDYHRRLQLAGFGEKIFGVNLPFHHIGSATINQTPQTRDAFRPKFERCQQVYLEKWGGLPGKERFLLPFDQDPFASGPQRSSRCILFGQGRGEQDLAFYDAAEVAFYGQETV